MSFRLNYFFLIELNFHLGSESDWKEKSFALTKAKPNGNELKTLFFIHWMFYFPMNWMFEKNLNIIENSEQILIMQSILCLKKDWITELSLENELQWKPSFHSSAVLMASERERYCHHFVCKIRDSKPNCVFRISSYFLTFPFTQTSLSSREKVNDF